MGKRLLSLALALALCLSLTALAGAAPDLGSTEAGEDTGQAQTESPGEAAAPQGENTGEAQEGKPGEAGGTQTESPGETEETQEGEPGETGTAQEENPGETGTAQEETPGETGGTQEETSVETGVTQEENSGEAGGTQEENPGEAGTAQEENPGEAEGTQEETPGDTGTSEEEPPEDGTAEGEMPGAVEPEAPGEGEELPMDGTGTIQATVSWSEMYFVLQEGYDPEKGEAVYTWSVYEEGSNRVTVTNNCEINIQAQYRYIVAEGSAFNSHLYFFTSQEDATAAGQEMTAPGEKPENAGEDWTGRTNYNLVAGPTGGAIAPDGYETWYAMFVDVPTNVDAALAEQEQEEDGFATAGSLSVTVFPYTPDP